MQNVEKIVDKLPVNAYDKRKALQIIERRCGMGFTVKQWRLAKGISQEHMANACHVHRNTYAEWEDNPEKITIKNALVISRELGESVNTIFFTH